MANSFVHLSTRHYSDRRGRGRNARRAPPPLHAPTDGRGAYFATRPALFVSLHAPHGSSRALAPLRETCGWVTGGRGAVTRSIRKMRIRRLRISESKLLGNSPRTEEFHPLEVKEAAGFKPSEIRILGSRIDRSGGFEQPETCQILRSTAAPQGGVAVICVYIYI